MANSYAIERIPVSTLASGLELSVTLHTISNGPGPIVGVSAGIHGDEPIGVEVLRRLANVLRDTDELRGTVVLLPLANPLAYAANTRNTPLDHLNLNRLFPGDAGGWFSEQLAATIAERFLSKIDAYVDLHAGGAYPVVDYVYLTNAPHLSRAFGSKVLFRPEAAYDGTSESYVNARGVPAVTVELGGGLQFDERYAERTLAGILNVLRVQGVLTGAARPAPEQILLNDLAIIRPRHGGIYVPDLGLEAIGAEVSGGSVVGRIYHAQTFELLETIVAPYERNLLVLLRENLAPIDPGSYTLMAGDMATAEVLAAE